MKILVPVKRVVDYNVKVRVKSDESGVELAGVKMSMNPFDEIAVEEAIRLKEAGTASEVVAVSIGGAKVEDVLRTALALGVDNAIRVQTPEDTVIQPLAAAKILQKIVEQQSPDLVILGKQAIDDDANQTGQMLAALLGWGQGTFAWALKIDGSAVEVVREVDGGEMRVGLNLPCVVTTDLRLNEPRYAKLPDIMKARSKPMETIEVDSLGVDIIPRVTVQKVSEPPKRAGGIKVANVDELLVKLKEVGAI